MVKLCYLGGSKILFLFFVIILIFLAVLFFLKYNGNDKNMNFEKVCINGECFGVEVAKTREERRKGLMGRESLAENTGMLFIFDKEGFHSFWMKNTKIPLDIIWIGEDNRIVHIEKNVPPCESDTCPSYKPAKKAKYALEISGSLADKLGIKIGDTANLPKNP